MSKMNETAALHALDGGGPAFPAQPLGSDGLPSSEAWCGMTLRDWFAGQALMGLASAYCGKCQQIADCEFATWAYQFADAMLAARKK